jgi:hypothetical protein
VIPWFSRFFPKSYHQEKGCVKNGFDRSPERCGHFDREKVTVFIDNKFPFFRIANGNAELGSAKEQTTSSSPRVRRLGQGRVSDG